MDMTLDDISKALNPGGLLVLGAVRADVSDNIPGSGPDRGKDSTLILIGNAGSAIWPPFSSEGLDGKPDPLDRWTRRVLDGVSDELARQFDTRLSVLYPFEGPPYWPFQRWAIRSGAAHPTPIGPLIHPTYGPWHAYRGAFVIASSFFIPDPVKNDRACDTCADTPCLTTCPVEAFSGDDYDVPACADHLDNNRDGKCMNGGCLARRACPVGRDFHYAPAHARFHMQIFLDNHT